MVKYEIVEENKFKKEAERRWDAEVIKMGMHGIYGRVGRGDRLTLLPCKPRAIAICFEFKREGEEPTRIQLYYRRRFKRLGVPTYVVEKAEEALWLCEEAIRTKGIPERVNPLWDKQTRRRILSGSRLG